jgi:8-oxo-dGTP diphosphatase
MKLTALCYIRRCGKTLMLHRIKKDNDIHEGKWNGLGGKFEKGESPIECVKREVLEESGLVIKAPVFKGVLTFPSFKNDEDYYAYLFEAFDFEGDIVESDEGSLEWIDDDNIPNLNVWEGDLIFFEYMKKYRFFMAKFNYGNKILISHELEYFEV